MKKIQLMLAVALLPVAGPLTPHAEGGKPSGGGMSHSPAPPGTIGPTRSFSIAEAARTCAWKYPHNKV